MIPEDQKISGVFIVIAAYQEGRLIGSVVRELRQQFSAVVVVVDDGSTDDTFGAASAAGALVLRHAINRGQGAALQTGLDYAINAGARYVVTFDADGQHRPEDIPRLLSPLAEGKAEVALGSRFLGTTENMPFSRRVVLRAGVLFTRVFSRIEVTDTHNGLRAFSRRAALRIQLGEDRMAHASELLDQVASSGLPYTEIPVTIRYTDYSKAKGQSGLSSLRILVDYLSRKILGPA